MLSGRSGVHAAGMSIDVSLQGNRRASGDVVTGAVELEELGPILRLAAEVVDRAAERLVPHLESTDQVCDRYRAAAASWPTAPAPSYERLAGLLATLHDASAAVRSAAARCDGADRAVRAALG